MRRISAGVPAGGQFSASVRGEAAVDLNGREPEIAAAARAARPLKNQTPADLAETIRDEMWRIHGDSEEFQLTSAAIDLACQLHQDQRRASPTITTSGRPLPGSEPYVVHPLRNAVRIIRWEESDSDIVIAAVLHDVVEDQAERLALTEVRSLHGLDRTETRAVALHVIRDTFGANVARTVKAVSNPIPPAGQSLSREQKRGRYVAHVQQAIPDYRTFMVKAADFVDNALGCITRIPMHRQRDTWRGSTSRCASRSCGRPKRMRRRGIISTQTFFASSRAHTDTCSQSIHHQHSV